MSRLSEQHRSRAWLVAEYAVARKSLSTIAATAGCTSTTILSWLNKHGIKVRSRGGAMPVHIVKCLDCPAKLSLSTHWREPRCKSCRLKLKVKRAAAGVRSLRMYARRYKVMLHTMGYDDAQFDEMHEEIKRSILAYRDAPETRAARFDLAIEKRNSPKQQRLQEERRSTRKAAPSAARAESSRIKKAI